jgi:hypothetical protein
MEKETNSSITYSERFSSGSYQKEFKIFCSGEDGKSIFNNQEFVKAGLVQKVEDGQIIWTKP